MGGYWLEGERYGFLFAARCPSLLSKIVCEEVSLPLYVGHVHSLHGRFGNHDGPMFLGGDRSWIVVGKIGFFIFVLLRAVRRFFFVLFLLATLGLRYWFAWLDIGDTVKHAKVEVFLLGPASTHFFFFFFPPPPPPDHIFAGTLGHRSLVDWMADFQRALDRKAECGQYSVAAMAVVGRPAYLLDGKVSEGKTLYVILGLLQSF